jgi:hypothetical protein
MIAPVPVPPVFESQLFVLLLLVGVFAFLAGYLFGFALGERSGAARMDRQVRRNISLPPRPQR